jgi:hypothetical protein
MGDLQKRRAPDIWGTSCETTRKAMPRRARRPRNPLTQRQEAEATAWALTWSARAIEGELLNPLEHAARVERLGPDGAAVAEARMRRALERLRANAREVFRLACDVS